MSSSQQKYLFSLVRKISSSNKSSQLCVPKFSAKANLLILFTFSQDHVLGKIDAQEVVLKITFLFCPRIPIFPFVLVFIFLSPKL